MLYWQAGRRNWITRASRNQKSCYDVGVGGGYYLLIISITLLENDRSTLNPNLNPRRAPDATGYFPLVGCLHRKQLG